MHRAVTQPPEQERQSWTRAEFERDLIRCVDESFEDEVILDLSYSGKSGIAAWQTVDVPAVKNHKVVAMDQPFLVAPSPRVKDALDTLAGAIR